MARNKNTENEQNQEKEVIYASLSDRLFAGAIDLGLLYFIVVPASAILFPLLFGDGDLMEQALALAAASQPEIAQQPGKLLEFIATKHPQMFDQVMSQYFTKAAVQIAVIGAVVVPFIYRKGATPGKMVAGIKVADGITYGKLSLAQSAIRFLAYIPSVGALGFGILWSCFNDRKRAWHDILADTVVVMDENRWYKRIWDRILGRK